MGNFTGWTFAAVNAIASEVSNIQLRASIAWTLTTMRDRRHELLPLLEDADNQMTAVDLKHVHHDAFISSPYGARVLWSYLRLIKFYFKISKKREGGVEVCISNVCAG